MSNSIVSEDIFIEFLLNNYFKEDIGYLYKQIGTDIISCYYIRGGYYNPDTKLKVKINSSNSNNNSVIMEYFDWEDFKASIKGITRELRLSKILNKRL